MELKTEITAVSVYSDRARIVRRGRTDLKPGLQKLIISELPANLDRDSARGSASGTARATLQAVNLRRSIYAETPVEEIQKLEKEIDSLKDDRRQLDDRIAVQGGEREAVDALMRESRTFARGLARGQIGVDDQMAIFDNLRRRAETLSEGVVALTAQRRELERELKKAEDELAERQSLRGLQRQVAEIEVDVTEAGALDVELSYVVRGAGWKPLYDLRLMEDEGKEELEVGYLAQVSQDTGEDWQGVALSLSTARPTLAETVPELDPWYVSPVFPQPVPKAAPRKGGPVLLAAAPAPAQVAPEIGAELEQVVAEAEESVASVEASGTTVTYRVPGESSIPPDGTAQKVVIARFRLLPELDYVTAPKLVEAVYRRAKVINDSPYVFLPGRANLFVGDGYIGTIELELTAPQGEVELYLGTDDRVRVERELKRREVDKRVVGRRRRVVVGYEIELENLLPREAKVTVHDQIPVAGHEEIKVKLEAADPKPAEETELNLLRWEFTLSSKQKQSIRFDFNVDHPREMHLFGLP